MLSAPGEWRCEDHLDQAPGHDGCEAQGVLWMYPHLHRYDAEGFCTVCRCTRDEVLAGGVIALPA
jgi:hypothetical protein